MTTPGMPLSVVIAEDEAIAREHLRALVLGTPALRLVGEAGDGTSALALLAREAPDAAFLDVRMPGLDGLAVAERAAVPHVVFTTAYDAHAVAAFELGAVDYLLKPFGPERFARTVQRLLDAVAARRLADEDASAGDGDGPVPEVPAPADRWRTVQAGGDRPLARLFVRHRGRLLPVEVADVERLEADDDYVALVVRGRRHLVGMTLSALLPRFDPSAFVRIHRSHAVNLAHVAAIVPHDAGRYAVEMRDGTRVVASRTGTQALRALAGG